jgi:hypothetical protein
VIAALLLAAAWAASAAAGLRAIRRCGAVRGTVALVVPVLAFGAGAWVPAAPWVRAGILVYAIAALSKSLALSRERCRATALPRVVAFVAVYPGLHPEWAFARDPRADRRAGRAALAAGTAEVFLALAWAEVARRWGILDGPLYVAAWARAASLVLLLDGSFRAAAGAFEAVGLHGEEVFRDPWRLEDLRSFWGRRWNRVVGRTLALEVFAPSRRAVGAPLAVLATFLASGLLHEAVFHLATGRAPGAYVAFFLLHGLGILSLEALLPGPGRTLPGRLARRALAWAVLLATAPLFFGAAYREGVPLEGLVP